MCEPEVIGRAEELSNSVQSVIATYIIKQQLRVQKCLQHSLYPQAAHNLRREAGGCKEIPYSSYGKGES